MIQTIIQYKLFLIPIFVILFSQLLKFIFSSLKTGVKWNNIFEPGNFPSAHSAFVTSLVVVIGYYAKMHSGVFAIALCFAIITIYDAMRVRMQIGIQGRTINKLVKHIPSINTRHFPHLREHVGHYANEVFAGICIGIFLSFFWIYIIETYL